MPTPHFSPGRWNYDEKQFIFSALIGLILGACGHRMRWACSGLSFSPQRAHAPSTVVTATLFAREHALRGKIPAPLSRPPVRNAGYGARAIFFRSWSSTLRGTSPEIAPPN